MSSCSLPGLGSAASSSGQRSRSALERRSPSLAACSLALPWLLSPCSALKPLSVYRQGLRSLPKSRRVYETNKVYGFSALPPVDNHRLSTQYPSAVPIIPLLGTLLPGFASSH